jgi:hypothetical protein
MPTDSSQTARGAVAGAVAAGVWALQQPLDRRVFRVAYDDTELLGKLVTRGPGWPVAGVALHVLNGAAFGALYARVAPGLPLPAWARGPAVGLAEHLASWPLTVVSDRLHPARGELPALAGNPRAFGQALWRHLLFGTVLGELERRMNADDEDADAHAVTVYSSNGHGSVEHLAAAG